MSLFYTHLFFILFFFNDPATTEIYTLSLHDALPISHAQRHCGHDSTMTVYDPGPRSWWFQDRKSTRLNSSHVAISYAVFCLKKKKIQNYIENILFQSLILLTHLTLIINIQLHIYGCI